MPLELLELTDAIMEQVKIKELKPGYYVSHKKWGYLQYRGIVTRNPFTEEPKTPYRYLFFSPIDSDGNEQPDVVLTDGDEIVSIDHKTEEY
jgi:hypothetical protein